MLAKGLADEITAVVQPDLWPAVVATLQAELELSTNQTGATPPDLDATEVRAVAAWARARLCATCREEIASAGKGKPESETLDGMHPACRTAALASWYFDELQASS
jgi:hypothetical protein